MQNLLELSTKLETCGILVENHWSSLSFTYFFRNCPIEALSRGRAFAKICYALNRKLAELLLKTTGLACHLPTFFEIVPLKRFHVEEHLRKFVIMIVNLISKDLKFVSVIQNQIT